MDGALGEGGVPWKELKWKGVFRRGHLDLLEELDSRELGWWVGVMGGVEEKENAFRWLSWNCFAL